MKAHLVRVMRVSSKYIQPRKAAAALACERAAECVRTQCAKEARVALWDCTYGGGRVSTWVLARQAHAPLRVRSVL